MWEIVLSRDYAKWSEENWNNWLHTICRLDSGLGRPKICRFRGRNILAYKCNVTDKKNQDIAFNNTDVVRFDSLLIHISHGFFTAHVFNWFSLFSCFFLPQEQEWRWTTLPWDTHQQTDKLAFRPRNWLSTTTQLPFTFQTPGKLHSNRPWMKQSQRFYPKKERKRNLTFKNLSQLKQKYINL